MVKNTNACWFSRITAVLLFIIGFQMQAQKVYFAEEPPMVLDGSMDQIPNYIIEYSAKDNGIIQLELIQNNKEVVGQSSFMVRKRGSNTAKMSLALIAAKKPLAPGSFYHYKLTLYENSLSRKKSPSKTSMSLINSYAAPEPVQNELKKVGEQVIIHKVKVI